MKKLLFVLISTFLISCSKDDNNCFQCNQFLEPITETYGTYIKSNNEIELQYRFISPFRPKPEKNEIGIFGEINGYYFRIYKEGEVTLNGNTTLSFPVTDIERNESFVEIDGYYSRDIILELRIVAGSESDLEAFWFAKSGDSYLINLNNRNINALNIFEENKCRWIIDGDSGYYTGNIPIKGIKNVNEWISLY